MPKQTEVSLLLSLKDKASAVFKKVTGAANKFKDGVKRTMGAVREQFKTSMVSTVALGAAIAGFTMAAIRSVKQWVQASAKSFQEFEESLTAVYTLLDEDVFNKHAKDLEAGAIRIMQDYNLGIQDVNKSLFDSVSAGIAAGESIEFLEVAAKLAKGGVTQLSTSVDGMTSIINAYGLETEDATAVANAFFASQVKGKLTVKMLADNIGKVAPIAKAAGMSYQELMAAISQLTLSGLKAEEATTAMKGALQAIIRPSKESVELFKEMKIPIGEAAFKGEKFGSTMEKIKNSTKGSIDKIAALVPNIRGLLAITSVATEDGLVKYDDILQKVKNDTESLDRAFVKQMGTMKEMIATEKGKFIPATQKVGEAFSNVQLQSLKAANSFRDSGLALKDMTGVYGKLYSMLVKVIDKTAIFFGLKEDEKKAAEESTAAFLEDLQARNEGEREILAEHTEIKAEMEEEKNTADLERQQAAAEAAQAARDKADKIKAAADLKALNIKTGQDQGFINRKKQMDQIAETARLKFEAQKKVFDQMTAQQKLDLLKKTLGEERLMNDTQKMNELIAKGNFVEAKKIQDKLYLNTFVKMNETAIKDLDDGYKKHWSFLLAGQKLNAKERKETDKLMAQAFEDILTIMGKESLAAFRVMQGMAIVETTISAIQAAQAAFTSLVATIPGPVGLVLGTAAAIAAGVAGAIRVNEIRRQRPPQAEVGGDVKKGGLAELHDAEIVLNKGQAQEYKADSGTKVINLNMDGETLQQWIYRSEEEKELMTKEGLL